MNLNEFHEQLAAASYWLALIGRTCGEGALGCELIAEMDNPPVIMGDERVER